MRFAPLIFLSLAACSPKVVQVPVPVEVKVPVATPCPAPRVQSAPPIDELAIVNINPETQIDKDVDFWKATVLQLKAFSFGLLTENADLRSALKVCTDGQ